MSKLLIKGTEYEPVILRLVRSALQKQQRIADYNELYSKVASCEGYGSALKIIGEYVTLEDTVEKGISMF